MRFASILILQGVWRCLLAIHIERNVRTPYLSRGCVKHAPSARDRILLSSACCCVLKSWSAPTMMPNEDVSIPLSTRFTDYSAKFAKNEAGRRWKVAAEKLTHFSCWHRDSWTGLMPLCGLAAGALGITYNSSEPHNLEKTW